MHLTLKEQIHELAVMYIKEKGLISELETPEKLAELYDVVVKKFTTKYRELNPLKSPAPRKSGTTSRGVGFYD